MRILVFESDQKFINTLPFGFVECGHEVLITGSLEREKLDYLLKHFIPDITITLGWSDIHRGEQLKLLVEYVAKFKAPHIYWATEDPTFYEEFSLPLVNQLKPCHIFSVSSQAINDYKKEGYSASLLEFAYSTLLNTKTSPPLRYDISLVANAYPNVLYWYPDHYRSISMAILLAPLIKNNIHVDLFGNGWHEMDPYFDHPLDSNNLHAPLPYLQIGSLFRKSKVNLCLQNYANDVITMRTFEIMGSGALAISSPHQRLLEHFKIGQDLLIAKTPLESLELCQYYLDKEHLRQAICHHAHKVIATHHTYGHRAKEVLRLLKNIIL